MASTSNDAPNLTNTLYHSMGMKTLTYAQLLRSSPENISLWHCVHSNISVDGLIEAIFGENMIEELRRDSRRTLLTIRGYIEKVLEAMKGILDGDEMSKLEEHIRGNYNATTVSQQFFMEIFRRVVKCFDFNKPLMRQFVNFFRDILLYSKPLYIPAFSYNRFHMVFVNMNMNDVYETLVEDLEDTSLYYFTIIGRIIWFLIKLSIDTIRISIDVESFLVSTSIKPLRFYGVDGFEKLQSIEIKTELVAEEQQVEEEDVAGKSMDEIFEIVKNDRRIPEDWKSATRNLIEWYHELNKEHQMWKDRLDRL